MRITILRYLVGAILLFIVAAEYSGSVNLPGTSSEAKSTTLKLMFGASVSILLHVVVDSMIEKRAKSGGASNIILIPKYRMENKRLLANALIVTSGVILGLAKSRTGGPVRLDTALLAMGIIFGFINLSVHGGAVDEEVDMKCTPKASAEGCPEGTAEETVKYVRVKEFHDGVSTLFLNLQYLALILGIAALS